MSNWTNGNLIGKLSVGQGERGKSLEYMWRGTELGIKREDEEEYQFVNLAPPNDNEADGSGADGREIELQLGNGFIQWRYKGEEEWNNLINIDDLKGDKGDKGDKGETGSQGIKGTDGINGADGKDGVTPNIQVGTVTTLEEGQQVTVVMRGTTENPIFDFSIPKGARGLQGLAGADGTTPIKGQDYYTNEDKEELITEILNRIPNGNEVAY